jgi:hypothetical protein
VLHAHDAHPLGFSAEAQVDLVHLQHAHALESAVLPPPEVEVVIVDADDLQVPARRGLVEVHQALGVRVRKRAEENPLTRLKTAKFPAMPTASMVRISPLGQGWRDRTTRA